MPDAEDNALSKKSNGSLSRVPVMLTAGSIRLAFKKCYTTQDMEEIYDALMQKVRHGGKDSITAAKLLLEYGVGKPQDQPQIAESKDVYDVQAEIFGEDSPKPRLR